MNSARVPTKLPGHRPSGLRWSAILTLTASITAATFAVSDRPTRAADVVRPTVQLRHGETRGSGTIIVSIPNETWILTAAHVIDKAPDLKVELHRFNFGSRLTGLTEGGGWPRLVPVTVMATDVPADLALLQIRGMTAMPFVARLDPEAAEPKKGDLLTSVGIDRGLHLTTWKTTVEGAAMFDLKRGGGAHRFTVTTRQPEHGRSGGGLFRPDGAVVGVCTGQFDYKAGQKLGVFASMESLRSLLKAQGLETRVRPPVPQSGGTLAPDAAKPARALSESR
jgi:S1-C subfamily serine protease